MGGHVLRAVEAAADLSVGSALDRADHPDQGKELASGVPLGADPVVALANADVGIDFSVPDASIAALRAALASRVPLVIATTGFDNAQLAEILAASEQLPIVMAANFSLGINTLIGLVEQAAQKLPDYEIEVLEMHHSRKVDAPSGTALRLGEAAAAARGQRLADVATYHREGQTGPRPHEAIGMQTLRGGDVVGEHTVFLVGSGERLELTHRATSRDNFAVGAARAAHWIVSRPPGLYSMADVLG
jgi:4-hydroxy-tetrahydrodipicolinate reductase